MKIINHTHYLTADLRAILARVAKEELEPAKRKRMVVEVRYARGPWSSGLCTTLGGFHAIVRLGKHQATPDAFAKVAAHEFAHCRGMTHQTMPTRYKWASPTWRERYAWANELGIRRTPPKAKPSREEKRTKALQHAVAMHAKAVTRVKRAQTIERKWRLKVRRLRVATSASREVRAAASSRTPES